MIKDIAFLRDLLVFFLLRYNWFQST